MTKNSVNSEELKNAIQDSCKNYDPVKSEPKQAWSEKSGRLYKCRNWEKSGRLYKCTNWENELFIKYTKDFEGSCLFCYNWVTPEGNYRNRIPQKVALELYKKNSDKFIEYFQSRTSFTKKMILKEILSCSFVNEKVIEWLDKEESDLVRKVGLDTI